MRRRIFKSGNSLVVALPAELLTPLGLGDGAEVAVAADPEHGGILLRPAQPELPGVDAEFARRVDDFIARYRPALEALAKQ